MNEPLGEILSPINQLTLSDPYDYVDKRIQWISGGVLVWDSPRVVTSIETMETDDETVYYAMVEGSPTGIPLRNIILAE